MSSNTLFEAMKETDNETVTTNGMKAYKSTLDACLDLFCTGASCRYMPTQVRSKVLNAYNEDKTNCLRILFYLRDIRGKSGQGERSVFREGMRELLKFDYNLIISNDILSIIPEYGRWDDLISLWGINSTVNEEIASIVNHQLMSDVEALEDKQPSKVSLLAKWMPSCNTSSKKTRELARKLRKLAFPNMSEKIYRQILSALRKTIDIVETHLAQKDYTFDYSKLPSKASMKYKATFMRNDEARYRDYVNKLTKAIATGDNPDNVKVNTATLYPYEVIKPIINNYWYSNCSATDIAMADNRWKSLPDYFSNSAKKANWLVLADVSGSMTCCDCIPMAASISLAMYIAEHNTGIFKNKFMTFHTHPTLQEIDPKWRIDQKINYIKRDGWCGSTNVTAAFDTILKAALKHHIPASEMPEVLVIVSDMQFDSAVDSASSTLFERSKRKFEDAGYNLPKVVFWNVAAHDTGNIPVTMHESGAVIINGYKPGTFDMMIEQKSPIDFMNAVINQERYASINL